MNNERDHPGIQRPTDAELARVDMSDLDGVLYPNRTKPQIATEVHDDLATDYTPPLSEQVRDLEREAKLEAEIGAKFRDFAADSDQRLRAIVARRNELKARIAAGGTKQESLFGERT